MLNLSKSYIKSIKDQREEVTYLSPLDNNFDSRYEKTPLLYDTTNSKVYHSIKYRDIYIESDKDKYFKITEREQGRLDIIAQDYYNDATKWWIIAYANNLTNCFYVPIGTTLRIPYIINLVNA